jgi:gliding motility-associated-like protein
MRPICFCILLLLTTFAFCQNNNANWYFGYSAGLNFSTNPPTPLLNSAMPWAYCSATQSDDNGNLLFYTDGQTIYNSLHQVMANGTGLMGQGTPVQGALIIRKPGSQNLHYVFTMMGDGQPGGLNYSIVDMNLASGQGSVTVKNASVFPGPCHERLAATKHCNGTDYWIVVQEYTTNTWRSYLFSSSGISLNAVISSIGPVTHHVTVRAKFSPDGSKIAANFGTPFTLMQVVIYDFDNSTGQILSTESFSDMVSYPACIEFSADGSKLYSGDQNNSIIGNYLHQWDLCAGTGPAINASHQQTLISYMQELQLAINGKIYCALPGRGKISVINDPNNSLPNCNFADSGQYLGGGGRKCSPTLCNLVKTFSMSLQGFTHTLSPTAGCYAMQFTSGGPLTNVCAAPNYSVVSVKWDFGDPGSGTFNTSFTNNPLHLFSAPGSFTVKQILYYRCTSDTLKQVIVIPAPAVSIVTQPGCDGLASASVTVSGGSGSYSYTWLPGNSSGTVAGNLTAGSQTLMVKDLGLSCTLSTVFTVTVNPAPTLTIHPDKPLYICQGSIASVSITSNCTALSVQPSSGTTLTPLSMQVRPLSDQTYSISGALGNCSISKTLSLNVLANPTLQIQSDQKEACVNSTLALTAIGTGSFMWVGPDTYTSNAVRLYRMIENLAQLGTYSLFVTDTAGCKSATFISVPPGKAPEGEIRNMPAVVCAPFCGEFRLTAPAPDIRVQWQLEGVMAANRLQHCFTQAGNYALKGVLSSTENNCITKLEYGITVKRKPKADFSIYPNSLHDDLADPIQLKGENTSGDILSWSWYYHGTQQLSSYRLSGQSPEINRLEEGQYVIALVAANNDNCLDTVIKYITVEQHESIYIPNAFTPNADELNDRFLPQMRGVKKYDMVIYDRWSNRIFESAENPLGWDGTYKGQPCKSDVYTCRLSYTGNSGKFKVLIKEVMLLR